MNYSTENKNDGRVNPVIERLAVQVAMDKANMARWGLNILLFLFGLMFTIIFLTGRGAGVNIVAPVAACGLGGVWVIGRNKGKKLFQQYYGEELSTLTEKPKVKVTNAGTQLSSREKQILSYIALGQGNKQIAGDLGISEQTVKNHVTSILRRLEAKDRTEAVVIAIKQSLITIS